jgi:hypothetical protein
MTFKIECTRNWSKPPKYNTHFQWEDKQIALDYHYDDDYLKIFVDGDNWIEGNNEVLDKLINCLSNSMVGLSFEDCEVGEELNLDPEMM